jgi:hypothetical protein
MKDLETEMGEVWRRISNTGTLEACLMAAWRSISDDQLEGLVRSMVARLQAAIDAEGNVTPY